MIRPLRVVLVLKTAQGGLFPLSHVDDLRARGHEVVAVLAPPEGPLSRALAARGVAVVDSPFDFGFRSPRSAAAGLLRLRRALRELAIESGHARPTLGPLPARRQPGSGGRQRHLSATG